MNQRKKCKLKSPEQGKNGKLERHMKVPHKPGALEEFCK